VTSVTLKISNIHNKNQLKDTIFYMDVRDLGLLYDNKNFTDIIDENVDHLSAKFGLLPRELLYILKTVTYKDSDMFLTAIKSNSYDIFDFIVNNLIHINLIDNHDWITIIDEALIEDTNYFIHILKQVPVNKVNYNKLLLVAINDNDHIMADYIINMAPENYAWNYRLVD
jgi:hypothetical protein